MGACAADRPELLAAVLQSSSQASNGNDGVRWSVGQVDGSWPFNTRAHGMCLLIGVRTPRRWCPRHTGGRHETATAAFPPRHGVGGAAKRRGRPTHAAGCQRGLPTRRQSRSGDVATAPRETRCQTPLVDRQPQAPVRGNQRKQPVGCPLNATVAPTRVRPPCGAQPRQPRPCQRMSA